MQNRNGRAEMRGENVGTINCPSCGATLVAGLRFCRMCGYRLGEGVEEYVPTQLLDPATPTAPRASSATDPFAPHQAWGVGPMQPVQPMQPLGMDSLNRQSDSSMWSWMSACNPKRASWWTWMILAFVLLSVVGGVVSTVRRNSRADGGQRSSAPVTSLMAEADEYDTADGGGAMIRGLAGPGTSLEAAGLVGGDIITNLDGKPVRDGETMKRLIGPMLPGQTVEVIYIRDGETKKTMLTTTVRDGFRGMDSLRQRAGGRGVLDVDFDDGDRVRLPNSNIYGVELDDVERNGPADLAGLKAGDIIIEFDGKPIRTAGDLRYRAGAATPGGIANIVVMRDGQQITIPVKMGRQR